MERQQLRYEDQVGRVASLIDEIARAYQARDFLRLTQLGNRLATDSVIAGALAKAEREEADGRADDGPAQAA